MTAKYYIYRNLNRGGFSVKHRGLVVDRLDAFEATNVEFRVSEASRNRACREQRRNVHAYIVCDEYKESRRKSPPRNWDQAYYHPLRTESFVRAGTSTPITTAKRVVALDGKAYVP